MSPTLGQLRIADKGTSGAVAKIRHRPQIRAGHPVILIDGGDPQIQHHIHLRGRPCFHQLAGGGDREEEETGIFLAGAVIVQHGIMPLPIGNAVFDDSPADTGVGNHPLLLEPFQDGERLILKAHSEPLLKFLDPADPFAGADSVGDPIQAAIGNTEVGIAGQDGKIKKTGASACANAPVRNQVLDELPVDPAAWVVYNLLDFKLIF